MCSIAGQVSWIILSYYSESSGLTICRYFSEKIINSGGAVIFGRQYLGTHCFRAYIDLFGSPLSGLYVCQNLGGYDR